MAKSIRRSGLWALTLASALAACGGGGSTSSPPAAQALQLDSAKSVTQTVGPAGGMLSTTAADGTVYTMSVPARALRSATAITLTPIASIADLPAGVSLAGGAHLTPEGQAFDSPVTLTIALPRLPSSALIPFTYARQLEQRRLYPATFAASTIKFKIVHFSGYAALLAQPDTADIIDPNVTYFPTPTAAGDQALQALVSASIGLQGQARVAAMQAALRGWLDNVIKPMVVSTQSITMIGVVPGSANYAAFETTLRLRGEMRVFDVAAKYAFLTNAGDLDSIFLDFQVAVRDAARHVIPLFNKACDAFPAAYVFAVPDVLAWQELARDSSATTLDPTLERPAVLDALCVQVAYDPNGGVDFPSGIQPGQTGTLGVRAGYSVNGGPVRFDQPLFVLLTGASNVSPAGLQAPLAPAPGASVQQTFIWNTATDEMRIDVEACLADEPLREVCGRAFVVRGSPAGNCPRYEVNVRGELDISRVFNVNAQAGFSTPGAYGGASLGGNLTLSLTSGYAGTALANGDVTYLVEMDSPGESIDSTWRWSVRSNVGAGGSCRATLSVGGVTRTITATNNDLQVLEIPVTVRHGDVLQAKLDAACSSPGLLPGTPEILVNANIGSTIDMLGIPSGRYRPVMCIP